MSAIPPEPFLNPYSTNTKNFESGSVKNNGLVKKPNFLTSKEARPCLIGLTAGAIILALAVAITIIALTCITSGTIAQSVVLSIAFTAVTVGSATLITKFFKIFQLYRENKKIEKQKEEKNKVKTFHDKQHERLVQHAIEIGSSVAVLGLGLGLTGASYSAGPAKPIISQSGKVVTAMGSNSLLMSTCRLINTRQLDHTDPGELEDPEKSAAFARKITITNMVIGSVCVVLGISLILLGGIGVVGVTPALAALFGTSFLSLGISQIIKEILKWPSVQIFKEKTKSKFEKSQFNQMLKKLKKPSKKENSSVQKSDFKGFIKQHKVAIAAAVIFILAGILLTFLTFLPGLTAYQAVIISTFGVKALTVTIPMALAFTTAGIFYKAQDRIRQKHAAQKEADKTIETKPKTSLQEIINQQAINDSDKKHELQESENQKDKESVASNQTSHKKSVTSNNETEAADDPISPEKAEQIKNRTALIVGAITMLISLALILLALIPGLGVVATGFIAIGQSALLMGSFLTLVELIKWLNHRLVNKKNLTPAT